MNGTQALCEAFKALASCREAGQGVAEKTPELHLKNARGLGGGEKEVGPLQGRDGPEASQKVEMGNGWEEGGSVTLVKSHSAQRPQPRGRWYSTLVHLPITRITKVAAEGPMVCVCFCSPGPPVPGTPVCT